MIGAGLLAKKAVERGLRAQALGEDEPRAGLRAVERYFESAGLTPYLEQLGFDLVGFGCTTCIGNSGPLPAPVAARDRRGRAGHLRRALRKPQLRGPHPPRRQGELPRLADAGRRLRARGPDGHRPHAASRSAATGAERRCSCATSGPAPPRSPTRSPRRSGGRCSSRVYGDVFEGDERWQALPVSEGELFDWEADSTYVRRPPYFDGMALEPGQIADLEGARCLAVLGDSVTTDHISSGGIDRAGLPGRRATCSSAVSRARTSTPTAPGAATTS